MMDGMIEKNSSAPQETARRSVQADRSRESQQPGREYVRARLLCVWGGGSTRQGQVILEYFILFAVLAVLTVLGSVAASNFLFGTDPAAPGVKTTLQGFFTQAANTMANPS